MSGPLVPSDGRAEKANQSPSGEYAADCPTTFTSDTMARSWASVGAGVAVWIGGVGGGSGVAVAGGSGDALAGGGEASPLGSVLALGSVVGATAVGVG